MRRTPDQPIPDYQVVAPIKRPNHGRKVFRAILTICVNVNDESGAQRNGQVRAESETPGESDSAGSYDLRASAGGGRASSID
jgi:hypothetical protein